MTAWRRVGRALLAIGAVGFAIIAYAYLTLPDVRALKSSNPSTTAFMELRGAEARAKGRPTRRVQRWVSYGRISPNLTRAVLVAEDDLFWRHEGLDVDQLQESLALDWARGRLTRVPRSPARTAAHPAGCPVLGSSRAAPVRVLGTCRCTPAGLALLRGSGRGAPRARATGRMRRDSGANRGRHTPGDSAGSSPA